MSEKQSGAVRLTKHFILYVIGTVNCGRGMTRLEITKVFFEIENWLKKRNNFLFCWIPYSSIDEWILNCGALLQKVVMPATGEALYLLSEHAHYIAFKEDAEKIQTLYSKMVEFDEPKWLLMMGNTDFPDSVNVPFGNLPKGMLTQSEYVAFPEGENPDLCQPLQSGDGDGLRGSSMREWDEWVLDSMRAAKRDKELLTEVLDDLEKPIKEILNNLNIGVD